MGSGGGAGALGRGDAVETGPDATADLPMDPDISSAVMSALEDSDLLDSVSLRGLDAVE